MTEKDIDPDPAENNYRQLTLFDVKIDPGIKDSEGNECPRPLTKNLMRKWLRKVKWENHKLEKRAVEKAKAKERRKVAREANIDLGPSRKSLKKMKSEKPKLNIGVIFDLSFEDLMIEKDRFKVIKQLLRCYSVNRRTEKPLQLHVTNLGKKSENDFSRHNGYQNWDMSFHSESFVDIFPREKIVYLTSESDNVIEEFSEDTYYVIGGLVDHNQHKGICFEKAKEFNIRHAQLPLSKYVSMKTRRVLTIDHVFEIIVKICEGRPWQEVLMNVLPERKGAQVFIPEDNVSSTTDVSNDM